MSNDNAIPLPANVQTADDYDAWIEQRAATRAAEAAATVNTTAQIAPVATPAPAAAPSVSSAIDRMIESQGKAYSDVLGALKGAGVELAVPQIDQRSISYNSSDDAFTTYGPAPAELPEGVTADSFVSDDGRVIEHEVQTITRTLDAMQAKLDAVTHDATTGQASYVLQGTQRTALETQLERARLSAAHDLSRLEALRDQRARIALAQRAEASEQSARAAFSQGNPAREALLADALAKAEAEDLARSIIAGRKVR